MTEKGWLGPYAPADRHADKVTMDHIIDLRRKIADLEKIVVRLETQRDNALAMVTDLQRKYAELTRK
jgi:hypothetical protein